VSTVGLDDRGRRSVGGRPYHVFEDAVVEVRDEEVRREQYGVVPAPARGY